MKVPRFRVGTKVRLSNGGPWMGVRGRFWEGEGWLYDCVSWKSLGDAGERWIYGEAYLEAFARELVFWPLPPRGTPARRDELLGIRVYEAVHGDDVLVVPAPADDVDALERYFFMGGT